MTCFEQQQLVHIAARPTDVLKTVSHHNPEQVIVSDTIPRKAFKPEQTKIFRSSGDLALLQSRRGYYHLPISSSTYTCLVPFKKQLTR